jgi:hypothetical protein
MISSDGTGMHADSVLIAYQTRRSPTGPPAPPDTAVNLAM